MDKSLAIGDKVKVLHLIKTSVGATWALRQMRELVKLGVEVHAVMPSGGPLIPRYRQCGVIIHAYDPAFTFNPLQIHRIIRRLRDTVEAVQPDIIHSHFVSTTLMMRLTLRQSSFIPRVFQVPGPLHLEHFLFRNLETKSAGQLDCWIASCEWTKQRYIKSGISDNRVFLAYYGVDMDKFVSKKKGALRALMSVGKDVKLIGMVAYMYAPKWYLGQTRGLKGHEDLIDAVAICLNRGLNVKGVLIGGAWNNATRYEKKVREYARRKCGEAVVCLGTRGDIADLYADLDLVIHPSHSENVGGAVESLLLARPTITTNIGGFPDLIKDGVTGYLVPPKKPNALADKIEYVLAHYDEAKHLAKNGQVLCQNLFDIRKNALDVYRIYQCILKQRPRQQSVS